MAGTENGEISSELCIMVIEKVCIRGRPTFSRLSASLLGAMIELAKFGTLLLGRSCTRWKATRMLFMLSLSTIPTGKFISHVTTMDDAQPYHD